MRLKSLAQYGLAMAALSHAVLTVAENIETQTPAKNLIIEENDIYIPEVRQQAERHAALEKWVKNFDFDWNQSATIMTNKAKVAEVATFLSKINPNLPLNKDDQILVGDLSYQIGTYYAHIAREPDMAIDKLTAAETLLNTPEAKAWCDDQLAYAYELKYAKDRLSADKDKALYYSSKVITDLYPGAKNKIVAFAYGVKGRVQRDAHDYNQAELSLKTAVDIYEGLPNGKDDAYARTKTKLADTLLEKSNFDKKNGDKQAMAILQELKQYWQSKGNVNQNPYAANNFISLGNAYLQMDNPKEAQAAIKQAIVIIEAVYGAPSTELAKPYELLSEAYKKTGDQKLADAYAQKAMTMLAKG